MSTDVEEHYRRHVIPPALATVVAASLFLVATVFIDAAASRWLAARASRSWPSTEGIIIESRLPSNCTHCLPVINYRYVVNSQSYVGDRLVAGTQDYYGPLEAEAKVVQYAVGRKVTVFYDPSNPSMSSLEPGTFRGAVYLFSVISLLVFGSALFLFLRVYRGRPRNESSA